jgi:hypothetical protein
VKTASAAQATDAVSTACRVVDFNVNTSHLDQMTGTYVPGTFGSGCSTADASQIVPMTGTYLPDSSFHTPETSDYSVTDRSFRTPETSDYSARR